MFKRIFNNGPINSITTAAAIVALASFVSRILGLFRDRVLAGQFGAGEMLDIYYAAFRLPDFIYNFLILGALSAGFIPLLATYLKSRDATSEAFRFANVILSIGIVIIVPIIILGVALAPLFVKWIVAPGFSSEQQQLTVALSRIMFLSPLLLGISGVMAGILQSFKRFFIYSLAPIFYNIGIIIGALFFTERWGIKGLAWGVVLGAAMHFLIQLPAAVSLGYRWQWLLDFGHQQLKRFVKLMIPRTLHLFIFQLNLVVVTIIASHLSDGSIAIFNFANNLQSFPIGIIGISFAVAAFPTLAHQIVAREKNRFVDSLAKTINEILFFILPLTVIIISLRAQIVRVILGTGAFDWEDTILTHWTLGLFSISLFAQSIIPLLSRAFYALNNTRTPFFISIIALALNVVLSIKFTFSLYLGVSGLALAFSLASIVNALGLWIALRIHFGYLKDWSIIFAVSKMILASIAMVPLIQLTKFFVHAYLTTETFIGIFIQGVLSAVIGLAVYVVVSWLLKSEELRVLVFAAKRRLLKWRSGMDLSSGREI